MMEVYALLRIISPPRYVWTPRANPSVPGIMPGLKKNPPPPNYICYRCGNRGHWIQLCPTNGVILINLRHSFLVSLITTLWYCRIPTTTVTNSRRPWVRQLHR